MKHRDSIRKSEFRGGAACADGCNAFLPVECDVIDPYTVIMTAQCIHCGRSQTRAGSVPNGDAEGFAEAFMTRGTTVTDRKRGTKQ